MRKQINQAIKARELGFPVAGFVEEIYEGAEILIPDMMWMYTDHDGSCPAEYTELYITGKVMAIMPVSPQADYYADDDGSWDDEGSLKVRVQTTTHFVMNYVLMRDDGLQVPFMHGRGTDIFFRMPDVAAV